MGTDIIRRSDAHGLLSEAFEETALVLGGLIAVHPIDDDLVWRFVRSIDGVRRKAVRRLDAAQTGTAAPVSTSPARHPAIEHFLAGLRRS